MPYNNGFPIGYQQYYQPYQVQQQAPVQQVAQSQQTQVRQGGFVPVQSENDAKMYPVAPGNSVTFIDENSPYCYVKTMGFSQLDRPKFEKYRLVKEEEPQEEQTPQVGSGISYATKDDVDAVWTEIKTIKEKMDSFTVKETKEDE